MEAISQFLKNQFPTHNVSIDFEIRVTQKLPSIYFEVKGLFLKNSPSSHNNSKEVNFSANFEIRTISRMLLAHFEVVSWFLKKSFPSENIFEIKFLIKFEIKIVSKYCHLYWSHESIFEEFISESKYF